jgi:hypothetical protein
MTGANVTLVQAQGMRTNVTVGTCTHDGQAYIGYQGFIGEIRAGNISPSTGTALWVHLEHMLIDFMIAARIRGY